MPSGVGEKTEDMKLGGVSIYLCVSLQGGVDNEVTLTAYITIALLEIPVPMTVCVSILTRASCAVPVYGNTELTRICSRLEK